MAAGPVVRDTVSWSAVVVYFAQSSTPTPIPSTPGGTGPVVGDAGSPLVIIGLAAITLIGTAVTAMAPTLLELAKRRSSTSSPPSLTSEPVPGNPQVVYSAQTGISMVEQAFATALDYRQQRDEATVERRRAMDDLRRARDHIRRQEAYIRQLEDRLGIRRGDNATDPQPRTDGPRWDPP